MGVREWAADGTGTGRGISPSSGVAGSNTVQAVSLVAGVTYDTGALISGDRNDRRMWALHMGFIAEEVVPTVPAPVVAEAWRGGSRQASLARLLAGCDIEEMSATQARHVGELAGRADHEDVVDVTVVEGAVRRDDLVIVTSDESHIQKIINATRKRIRIV